MKQAIENFGADGLSSDIDITHMSYDEKLTWLEKVLLSFSGDRFTKPSSPEDDINELLSSGLCYAPEDLLVTSMPGEAHRCHANAAACWEANRETCLIVTGYALFNGTWMQHSWLMSYDPYSGDEATLIETTEKADDYFGIILTPEQCEEFLKHNFL
ncbi:TPA: hypothetical protein I7730_16170 [Vibrio vulnificus]|uniref:Uncharacterized protein n=1 Tax=Vibrio vulnificus TaxID=672 RepID=A0A8H9N1X7_VIBVL|nr:hypothetical protein [Vibrio vulnificus]